MFGACDSNTAVGFMINKNLFKKKTSKYKSNKKMKKP